MQALHADILMVIFGHFNHDSGRIFRIFFRNCSKYYFREFNIQKYQISNILLIITLRDQFHKLLELVTTFRSSHAVLLIDPHLNGDETEAYKPTGGMKSFHGFDIESHQDSELVIVRLFDLVKASVVGIKTSITPAVDGVAGTKVHALGLCRMSWSFAPGYTSAILEIAIL